MFTSISIFKFTWRSNLFDSLSFIRRPLVSSFQLLSTRFSRFWKIIMNGLCSTSSLLSYTRYQYWKLKKKLVSNIWNLNMISHIKCMVILQHWSYYQYIFLDLSQLIVIGRSDLKWFYLITSFVYENVIFQPLTPTIFDTILKCLILQHKDLFKKWLQQVPTNVHPHPFHVISKSALHMQSTSPRQYIMSIKKIKNKINT